MFRGQFSFPRIAEGRALPSVPGGGGQASGVWPRCPEGGGFDSGAEGLFGATQVPAAEAAAAEAAADGGEQRGSVAATRI